MIRTVYSIDAVPTNWIFQHYCKLPQQLHGQDMTIRSVFNVERTPSMCIYYDGKKYKFKDFSSGEQGSAIDLVMKLFNIYYYDAVNKIVNDYTNRKDEEEEQVTLTKAEKFKVTSNVKRKWNQLDADYWTQFNIGSTILSKYNVAPLDQYTMTREEDVILTSGQHIYGYFKNNGELYKVYQPYKLKRKFTNVTSYLQGSEQLVYKAPLLVICSSLKDVMTLDTLGFDLESVAPSSETTMVEKSVLAAYSLKYKGIATFFDNDKAGKDGMQKYEDMYGIPGIYLKLSKDLSDSVRDFDAEKVRSYLKPLIPQ